jgi:hypothetical protein
MNFNGSKTIGDEPGWRGMFDGVYSSELEQLQLAGLVYLLTSRR